MTDAYRLDEVRYLVEDYVASAADALTLDHSVVPVGRIRTYLAAAYYPSATETKTIWWAIIGRGNNIFPVTRPVSIAADTLTRFPLVQEGLELKLYPGEKLRIYRDSATVGSTIRIYARYIDVDLPITKYYEPQRDVSEKRRQHGFAPDGILGRVRGGLGSHAERTPPSEQVGGKRER